MNLPNRLTVFRMILAPVFLVVMTVEFKWHFAVALGIFIVASITDLLDGKIARKQGLVTNFGKFLDPIADKVLTTAAFLGLLFLDIDAYYGILWITLIVILREFTVASLRMLCASNGNVVAADMWGKVKTVIQMCAIILVLATECFKADIVPMIPASMIIPVCILEIACNVLLWASAGLTVISGLNYVIKNRSVIDLHK